MEKELTSAMIWSLFDSLHEGILIAETDGTILYLNDAAGMFLGLPSHVSSLQALSHLFTPPTQWQECLSPPFSTTISAGNGRFLTLHTHSIEFNGSRYVQIVLTANRLPTNNHHAEEAELFQQDVDRSREFELLLASSNAFSSTLDKATILETLARQAIEAIQGTGCTIYQWLSTQDELVILHDLSNEQETAVPPTANRLPIPDSAILAATLKRQQPQTLVLTSEDGHNLPLSAWVTPEMSVCTLIPLVLTGETYGFIQLLTKNGRNPNAAQHEQKLLTALANQAASALEIALIFEDTYERERFYGAMGNVSLALNSSLDRETVLNLICSEGRRIFNVDGAYIWQLEGDQLVGSAAAGHGEAEFLGTIIDKDDTTSFVTQLAQSGEPTFVNRITNKTQVEVRLPQPEIIQSVLGVPLLREDDLTGILILADTQQPNRFTNKDISWATTFGGQVAIALQNAKLFEELRSFNETLDHRVMERTQALNDESNRVKILLRITTELSASLDQDRVLNQALHLVNGVVNAEEGAILLIDQESGEFIFQAAIGGERPIPIGGIPSGMMRNEGLAGWMIDNRSAVIVHDTRQDPRWLERETSTKQRSVLGVPLVSNEDEEVIGVLMMFHTRPNSFTDQQLDLVEAAAIQVTNAISNASLYKLIFEQAEQLGSMLRTEIIQKANLEAILESIADGVIVADSQNKVDIANLPACNILGIPRNQLLGKSINELLGLYGHFGESWLHTINDWAHNADRIEQWTFLADQLEIEDKFISVHLSPVLSDNQFYGTVSIFRDITKEVEVDKLKSEFVSTVSHELRTPMTSIKGYADLMLMGAAGEMTEPQIRYLEVIKNNADRLHMLVNDLLDISRIETGKTGLDLRPLDIPQIIGQVVEGHLNGRIQHEGRTIQVSTELAPSLPLVNADHARITQILTNLVDNALNYTPDNGRITINARATHSYVHISVKDSGIGIAKENQDKIFDRFYRADDSDVQRVPGTGLGLAIVRSLIEMHGGRLKVESELGKGSTFTFNIPVVIEDSDPT